MTLLKQIEIGRRVRARRVLLYGIRGVGTTTLAAALPAAVLLPCGADLPYVDAQRLPTVRRMRDVQRTLHALYAEPHAFGTLVVDPLDALERVVLDEVAAEYGLEQPEAAPLARGYTLALPYWRQLLDGLTLLGSERGMHVVLVGPAQAERTPRQPLYGAGRDALAPFAPERYAPAVHRTASALLQSWCDNVLFAAPADGQASCLGRAHRPASSTCNVAAHSAAEARVIYTQPSASHVAKNHLDLPALLPMLAAALCPYFVPAAAPPVTG